MTLKSSLKVLTEAKLTERADVLLRPFERPIGVLDQVTAMVRAFRATGGVVCGDQMAYLFRSRSRQPVSIIARWIVSRRVVCFEWNCQTMLPLFQFDLTSMSLRPNVAQIVQELVGTYDDWDLALWFASPNAWLDGAAPVEMIQQDPCAVLNTARADRFIAAA